MLTSKDITGVAVMAPTPCVPGGEHWSHGDSVDLEERGKRIDTSHLVHTLIVQREAYFD